MLETKVRTLLTSFHLISTKTTVFYYDPHFMTENTETLVSLYILNGLYYWF